MTTQNPGSPLASTQPTETEPKLAFREALDAVRAEAAAVEVDDLIPIALDIPAAAIAIRGALNQLPAIRERIVAELPRFDVARFDRLQTYARALTQAHADYLAASRPPAPVAELTEELKGIRETLLSDVQAAAKRKLVDGTRLGELKGALGSKNIGMDVLVLCSILRSSWSSVAGHTGVKLEELDHAEQLADSLQYAVATKEHSAATITQAAELRQQVYTLTLDAYDDARRAVIFLRWNDNDADDIAPSLFAGRKPRAHNGEEEAAPAPGTQPAPGTEVTKPPALAPAADNGHGGAMPVISPGMPGASPFTNS